jgi:hypothetical protein
MKTATASKPAKGSKRPARTRTPAVPTLHLSPMQLRFATTLTPTERREYEARVRSVARLLASDEGKALAAIVEQTKALDDQIGLFQRTFGNSNILPGSVWTNLDEIASRLIGPHTDMARELNPELP